MPHHDPLALGDQEAEAILSSILGHEQGPTAALEAQSVQNFTQKHLPVFGALSRLQQGTVDPTGDVTL